LNPPWEIPTSIITDEILPKLDAEPLYLVNNDMDVVSGNWENPGSLRIRQRPGTGNSLGHMKFQMQNQWNIYLHDTPSRALFAEDERYFSHGCIRVQDPQELAANLLSGTSVEDLNDGIASGETQTIPLETPLPVFVMYWTVFTDKEGHLNFRRDAYGRDAQTVAALADADVLLPASRVVVSGN
jgi:L,D-transpeptidase YcbB